jgi:AcrR family transcriptional regulator
MTDVVNPMTRRERARATRLRILDAAARLFAEEGYAGTTMQGVATAAGVAVQTVYLVFRTKADLLIDTMLLLAWGPDQAPDPRPTWMHEAFTAPNGAARRVAVAVDGGVEVYRKVAPLLPALIAGSSADPTVRTAWQRVLDGRRAGMSTLAGVMGDRGELAPGVSAAYAADVLIALHRHELFLAFTRECGWSVEQFKAWLFDALCSQLLPPDVASAARRPGSPAVSGTSFESALQALPGRPDRHSG